jgi:hypothetical protein
MTILFDRSKAFYVSGNGVSALTQRLGKDIATSRISYTLCYSLRVNNMCASYTHVICQYGIIDYKFKLYFDRRSVGQFVLVSGPPLGHTTRFLLLSSCCEAPSLTRGWVCNLLVQLLLGLARAITLGSKSRRTDGHILVSHLRLPRPGRPGLRIYIPQEQGGPVIPPDTGFPFRRLLDSQGYSGGILTPPPHGSPSITWCVFYRTLPS